MSEKNYTIEVSDYNGVIFHTKVGKFRVSVNNNNEIEVYVSDGLLLTSQRSMNIVMIRNEPWWDEHTGTGIIEHILQEEGKSDDEKARTIYRLLRGVEKL